MTKLNKIGNIEGLKCREVVGGLDATTVSKKGILKTNTARAFSLNIRKTKNRRGVKAVDFGLITSKASTWIEALNVEKAIVNLGKDKVDVENFCKSLVLVGFSRNTFKKVFVSGKERIVINTELGMVYVGQKGGIFYPITEGEEGGKSYEQLMEEGYVAYKLLIPTDGSKRKDKTFLIEDSIDRIEYLDHISNGMYSKYVENNGTKVAINEVSKFISRFSLIKSPGKNVTVVNGATFLDQKGSFLFGLGKDKAFKVDGIIIGRASWGMNVFNLKSQKEAIGTVIQGRFKGYNLSKFQLVFMQDELYETVVKMHMEMGLLKVTGDEDEFVKNSNFLIDNNAKKCETNKGEMYFTAMAFGKSTDGQLSMQALEKVLFCSAMLGQDRFEATKEYLRELAMDNITDLVNSVVETKEFKLYKNIKNNKVVAPYSNDVLKSVNALNPSAAWSAISQVTNTVAKTAQKLSLKSKGKYGSKILNHVALGDFLTELLGESILGKDEGISGRVSRGLDTDGDYAEEYCECVIFKYPSVYVKEYVYLKILSMKEVMRRIDETKASNAMKRMVKFFVSNISDSTFILPGYVEVISLLAGMDFDFDKIVAVFDKEIVNVFKDYIARFGSESLFIDPSVTLNKVSDSVFKRKLSSKLKGNFVIPGNINAKKIELALRDDFVADSMFFHINSVEARESIGMITIYNNIILAMLVHYITTDDDKYIKHFLREVEIDRHVNRHKDAIDEAKGEYRVLMDKLAVRKDGKIQITVEYVDTMLQVFHFCKQNRRNYIEFLLDCSRVLRLAQEGTIDSVKTAIYLTNRIICDSVMIESLMEIEVVYITEKDQSGFADFSSVQLVRKMPKAQKINRRIYNRNNDTMEQTDEKLDVLVLKDPMAEIQDFIKDLYNTEIKEFFMANKENYRYTEKETEDMNTIFNVLYANEYNQSIIDMIFNIKSLYIGNMIEAAKLRDELDPDTENGEASKVNETLNKRNEILIGSASRLLDNIDYSQVGDTKYNRGALMHAIGCMKEGTIDPASKNKFATTIARSYSLNFLLNEGKIEAKGKILQINDKSLIGQTIRVEEGYHEGLVIKEDYTGEVEVVDAKTVRASIDITIEEENKEINNNMITFIFDSEEMSYEDFFKSMNRQSVIRLEEIRTGKYRGEMKVLYSADENSDFVGVGLLDMSDAMNLEEYYYVNNGFNTKLMFQEVVNHRTQTTFKNGVCLSISIAE